MNWTLAPILGFSLAMDALAVSIAIVLCRGPLGTRGMTRVAGAFGFFQGVMPLAGWLFASRFTLFICCVDHWIAFILLFAVGAKMIYEGLKKDEECDYSSDPTRGWLLVVLAVGTSLDALAVGVSFVALKVPPVYTSAVIGAITFLMCIAGMVFARRLGPSLRGRMVILGGVILMMIGAKILTSHLWGG